MASDGKLEFPELEKVSTDPKYVNKVVDYQKKIRVLLHNHRVNSLKF